MPIRVSHDESMQDVLGIAAIGDGYILRNDGVAIGIAEITPPDVRLLDDASLEQLLDTYVTVLNASSERIFLYTYAVAPDMRPLLRTLEATQAQAPDLTSFIVLQALGGMVRTTVHALTDRPILRWIIAVPTVQPELPPRGVWGELQPAAIVGRLTRLRGDPVTEALNRMRRLLGALTVLGTEPPPRLMPAADIRALLMLALDPIHAHVHPLPVILIRPLQMASDISGA